MKVIDLLNMVSNGEKLPKKVRYAGIIFENKDGDLLNDNDYSLFEHRHNASEKLLPMLNDLVEIIEDTRNKDKKIKYIDYLDFKEYSDEDKMWCLSNKINELVEKLNGDTDE